MEIDAREAQQALDSIQRGRDAAADRLVTPAWYHPVLGLLSAGMVIGYGFLSPIFAAATVPIYLGGVFALATAYKRLTGVWVSGHKAGKASRWAFALGAAMLVCLVGAVLRYALGGPAWLVWLLAGTVIVATVLLGVRFDRALRAQLRSGS